MRERERRSQHGDRSRGRRLGAARRGAAAWLVLCGVSSYPALSSAQVELGTALSSLARAGHSELPELLGGPDGRLALLAEYPDPSVGIVARYVARSDVTGFVRDNPGVKLFWAPPRKPLLDVADGFIRGRAFRQSTGSSGKGVIVGIVDTGVDVTHPDLRTADGKSRVRYLLDFSQQAAGKQAALEARYGCGGELGCAIYSNADLDELLENEASDDEPGDDIGHGTHVASLALGNGLGSSKPIYIGVAPEAELIAVRVDRARGGNIYDADIVQAVRFVFERATELGMPAVVNLSLGSDFGAHDGSSAFERALASFVGPDQPGRAIVVSAGNSATQYKEYPTNEPGPYGIHTEVHVPRGAEVEVPILTPSAELGGRRGGKLYVWIGLRPGDDLAVAVDDALGEWIPSVAPGESRSQARTSHEAEQYEGLVLNGEASDEIEVPSQNAVVIIDGDFEPGSRFTLRLSGHGTANLWLQSTGGLAPETSTGALFPRSQKQGTISVPASSEALIAVGATVNRTRWRDYEGRLTDFAEVLVPGLAVDSVAYFSAAGPNARGALKPDLVAPGMFVAGALSARADPRAEHPFLPSIFSGFALCARECFVVDDRHAITSGTSMSAPLVSGAVALLFERRPELTQEGVRALLQAGARAPAAGAPDISQLGAGALDLDGTLAALIAEDSPIDRRPTTRSRIALAASYAHPDEAWPLRGLLELRDDADAVADGFDPRRLELVLRGGKLARKLLRVAPGLYSFEVITRAGTGGQQLELELRFDGEKLVEQSLPIAVDHALSQNDASAEGGCSFRHGRRENGWALLLFACALLAGRLHMRARYTVQAAGSKGRTSGS